MAIQTFDPSMGVTSKEITQECVKISLHIKIPTWSLLTESAVNAKKKKKSTSTVYPMGTCPLSKYRQRAKKFLLHHGIAFDGGYLINKADASEVTDMLMATGRAFNADIDDALAMYDTGVIELANEARMSGDTQDADFILKAYSDRGGMAGYRKDVGFRFSAFEIEPAKGTNVPAELDAFAEDVGGLLGTLCKEVNEIWKTRPSIDASKRNSQAAHRKFFGVISKKLKALAFINPNIYGIINEIDNTIIPILGSSAMTDTERLAVAGMYENMRDLSRVLAGNGSTSDISADAQDADDVASEASANADWVDAVATNADDMSASESEAVSLLLGSNSSDVGEDTEDVSPQPLPKKSAGIVAGW